MAFSAVSSDQAPDLTTINSILRNKIDGVNPSGVNGISFAPNTSAYLVDMTYGGNLKRAICGVETPADGSMFSSDDCVATKGYVDSKNTLKTNQDVPTDFFVQYDQPGSEDHMVFYDSGEPVFSVKKGIILDAVPTMHRTSVTSNLTYSNMSPDDCQVLSFSVKAPSGFDSSNGFAVVENITTKSTSSASSRDIVTIPHGFTSIGDSSVTLEVQFFNNSTYTASFICTVNITFIWFA